MSQQRQRPRPSQPQKAPARRFPVIPVVVGGIVLLAAVAIIVTSLGGKSTPKDERPNLEQTRAVKVGGTVLPDFESTDKDPAVGTPAPTVEGQNFDGTPVAITNDGSPKVVLFVAHWCPHCQKEVPLLADWLRTHQLPQGMKLFTVSTGVRSDYPNFPPSAWLQREEWRVPTMADDAKGTAAHQFGLTGYPYFVAVDSSGKVVARASGELPIASWEAVLAKTAGQSGAANTPVTNGASSSATSTPSG